MSSPTDDAVLVGEDDLAAIVDGVWESYLDPEGIAPLLESVVDGQPVTVTAAVSMTGAWQGHVVVGLSDRGARLVAAAFAGSAPDAVTDADVADAVGELANIVGGNVKSLLPGPSELSLPHVLVGAEGQQVWPSAYELCRLDRDWCGEPVRTTVWTLTTTPA